ncbi:MAG: RNA-binding protein [Deltaproteobacteria bacterium HGW-Deltaproteobacteria-15]|jgi:predicted RNA-binding protein|nr:MAG: RNA-binding protein [Deltaproteobacteria bacterium HGW-Deltaproteobacteria-15]
MCEAAAFLLKDQKEELLLESVEVIETGENDVTLVNIFGERKVIRAKIKSFSLVDHKIVLEPM